MYLIINRISVLSQFFQLFTFNLGRIVLLMVLASSLVLTSPFQLVGAGGGLMELNRDVVS